MDLAVEHDPCFGGDVFAEHEIGFAEAQGEDELAEPAAEWHTPLALIAGADVFVVVGVAKLIPFTAHKDDIVHGFAVVDLGQSHF